MSSRRFLKSPEFKYIAVVILPLAAMLYSQIVNFTILAFGEQVLLETMPIDPRDILRGDYVTLNYKISLIDEEILADALGEADEDFDYLDYREHAGREIFVTLQKDEIGIGTVKSLSVTRPQGELYLRGAIVIAGRLSGVNYGIGVYYVPEGTGLEIENKIAGMDGTQILVDARVLRGRPVIKGLLEFRESVLEPVRPGESPAFPGQQRLILP